MVSLEQAEKEFLGWFEYKKLPKRMLEKKADDKEVIIDAIMEESISIDPESYEIKQVLKFPKEQIKELSFKPRVTEGVLASATRGIKIDDLIGQMPICYISAITGTDRALIRSMESVDTVVGKSIAAFFST